MTFLYEQLERVAKSTESASERAVTVGKIANADKGRQQVRLYGECLERQYGVKPVLYFTNGHDIWVDDRIYPERRLTAFHSIDDLDRLVQRQTRGYD